MGTDYLYRPVTAGLFLGINMNVLHAALTTAVLVAVAAVLMLSVIGSAWQAGWF